MDENKRLSVFSVALLTVALVCFGGNQPAKAEQGEVVIGLNYPGAGPYAKQGQEQKRAAELAAEEINASGGILGKKIKLVLKDTRGLSRLAKENAIELYDKENAQMILGGTSSMEAIVMGRVAKAKNKLYIATKAYSTEITAEEGHKFVFRECYDSRMAAKVLAEHLRTKFSQRKYFYITTDSSWGWTTEEAFREFTYTTDKDDYKGYLTEEGARDYKEVLNLAKDAEAEVLVLVLFGKDMETAVKQAYEMGLKKKMQIVVPTMTIDMAQGAGPEVVEGILSTTDWYWKIPFDDNYTKGMDFVKKYDEKFKRYPSSSAASAYVSLYQYKEAVERAKTFDTKPVINALEGHKYIGVKDEQVWRNWDHQSVQTVYAIRCKKPEEVKKDKYQMDYFEIFTKMKGEVAAIDSDDWGKLRAQVTAPGSLEF
jgi:branched-chain amino acid transport system substrate-binding protein